MLIQTEKCLLFPTQNVDSHYTALCESLKVLRNLFFKTWRYKDIWRILLMITSLQKIRFTLPKNLCFISNPIKTMISTMCEIILTSSLSVGSSCSPSLNKFWQIKNTTTNCGESLTDVNVTYKWIHSIQFLSFCTSSLAKSSKTLRFRFIVLWLY